MADISVFPRGNRFKDVTGQRFGRLIVLEEAGRDKRGNALWRVRCDCGNVSVALGWSLRRGHTTSCGCLNRERISESLTKHGMKGSPEYNCWQAMIQRCTNENAPHFEHYGGRGITVCDRWLDRFDVFYADMGPRPEDTTLDRIDNEKGYEPGNCRWATQKEQTRNQRRTLMVELNGERMSLAEAAERFGVKYHTAYARINRGLSPDEAFT